MSNRRWFFSGTFVFAALFSPVVDADEGRDYLSSFKECNQCPEMIVIPPGTFLMGATESEPQRGPREGPVREVNIAAPFALGKYEVTFAEWDACAAAGACPVHDLMDRNWGRGRMPVILVTWADAQAYVAWLSKVTGKTYRLPSEAEWEYAARAGTTTAFSTGETITTAQANFDGRYTYNGSHEGEYRERTVPVGSYPPNAFGLHDVHGNVAEYVEDCWHETLEGAPPDGSAWVEENCPKRAQRNGAWNARPAFIRSAVRNWVDPYYGRSTYGLRVARDLE